MQASVLGSYKAVRQDKKQEAATLKVNGVKMLAKAYIKNYLKIIFFIDIIIIQGYNICIKIFLHFACFIVKYVQKLNILAKNYFGYRR